MRQEASPVLDNIAEILQWFFANYECRRCADHELVEVVDIGDLPGALVAAQDLFAVTLVNRRFHDTPQGTRAVAIRFLLDHTSDWVKKAL